MGLWLEWAGCPEPEDSDCACSFHAWLGAVEEFIRLIDEDWYQVADFYREPTMETDELDGRKP